MVHGSEKSYAVASCEAGMLLIRGGVDIGIRPEMSAPGVGAAHPPGQVLLPPLVGAKYPRMTAGLQPSWRYHVPRDLS